MPKPMKTLEPQQERSRESLRKLLKAATEVLGQHGVEGTTIPRIAQHAGLTPGAVYRRFRDKDELLETAILGILERQDERLKEGMTPEMAARIPLDVFVGPATVFEIPGVRSIARSHLENLDWSGVERVLFKTDNSSHWNDGRFYEESVYRWDS